MIKRSAYSLIFLILLTSYNVVAQQVKLVKTTHLNNYPSASALEFYNNSLYVMGDDATHLYILNNNHKVVDSLKVFRSKERRIDKDEKADLEAATLLKTQGKDYLVLFSSFSTDKRNNILQFELTDDKAMKKGKFDTYIENLKRVDVEELNIEGAAFINDRLVLSNRANLKNTKNQLIITSYNAGSGIKKDNKIISVNLPKTEGVAGISGITYLAEKDILLFTASTELTDNAYTDGDIGESYLGFIKNFSQKLNEQSIKVEDMINISKHLSKKNVYKIESIAIEKLAGNKLTIHLAADNDNGKSSLFKLNITLP